MLREGVFPPVRALSNPMRAETERRTGEILARDAVFRLKRILYSRKRDGETGWVTIPVHLLNQATILSELLRTSPLGTWAGFGLVAI